MYRFIVTYEIVTPESAENGESDEQGYECIGCTLRQAVEAVTGTRTNAVDGVECVEPSASDISAARWVTVLNGMEFETGAQESRSLHFPDHMTAASKRRVCRMLGARA